MHIDEGYPLTLLVGGRTRNLVLRRGISRGRNLPVFTILRIDFTAPLPCLRERAFGNHFANLLDAIRFMSK